MKARLEPLLRSSCPFSETPELNGPTTWVEPEVVAEVNFQGWTEDGSLRAPVFLRLRDDVDPKAVRRVEPAGGLQATANARPHAGSHVDEVVAQLENRKTAFTIAVVRTGSA